MKIVFSSIRVELCIIRVLKWQLVSRHNIRVEFFTEGSFMTYNGSWFLHITFWLNSFSTEISCLQKTWFLPTLGLNTFSTLGSFLQITIGFTDTNMVCMYVFFSTYLCT
jgi:hypothetical protein